MIEAEIDAVSFTAGGYRFAVEAHQVKGMLVAETDAVGTLAPGTLPIETLIGLPPEAGARRRRLVIGHRGDRVEVGEPVEFETLPAQALFALPPAVTTRLTLRGIKGLAILPAGAVLIVDLETLLTKAAGDAA